MNVNLQFFGTVGTRALLVVSGAPEPTDANSPEPAAPQRSSAFGLISAGVLVRMQARH